MCGIAGIYNLNSDPVSQELLKQMCDIMRHRGPDDEGYYVDNNIGFVHRRLVSLKGIFLDNNLAGGTYTKEAQNRSK